jgi:MFS family permease
MGARAATALLRHRPSGDAGGGSARRPRAGVGQRTRASHGGFNGLACRTVPEARSCGSHSPPASSGRRLLFLSIVPSYAATILKTKNLALLAAVAALALLASAGAQIVERRLAPNVRRDQAIGLVLLAAGLIAVVAAAPLGSLPLLVVGAVCAGAGHGLAFINAQQELNDLAPSERRGQVTAAFIAVIYAIVAGSVISAGALDRWFSLPLSVGAVSGILVLLALAAAISQIRLHEDRTRHPRRRPTSATRHEATPG